MPNALAHLMMYAWPLAVVVIFQRLPVPKAIVVSIVAGYLILPTQPTFSLPVLPSWDRELAATLPVLLMAIIKSRPATPRGPRPDYVLPGWMPGPTVLKLCIAALLIGPVFTTLTNTDAQVYPLRTQPGLSLYDAGSAISGALCMLIPFFLARKYLGRAEDHVMLLAVLCVAGLIYSLPALWEVRMSPRLNSQIYGFFPHDWRQHIRDGGYRPLVFLEHGLKLGLFFAMTLLATLGYWRIAPDRWKGPLLVAALWLAATLFLSKTLGAFIIAVLLAPVVLFLGTRLQLLAAAIVAGTVLVFPMMRAADLVPMQTITSTIGSVAEQGRVNSLQHRFNNEDLLLEKAEERPLFGWGGWGRSRVKNENGLDIVDTDGGWILTFGGGGWTGYLGKFGLLALPVVFLAFRRKSTEYPMATSLIAVVLAGNLVDLIPNTGLTIVTWVMAGALVARLEMQAGKASQAEAVPEGTAAAPPAAQAGPSYRRDLGRKAAAQRQTSAATSQYRRELTPRPRRS